MDNETEKIIIRGFYSTRGACIVNQRIWFTTCLNNYLCFIDIDKDDYIHIATELPEYGNNTDLYMKMLFYENFLILIPSTSNVITLYYLESKELKHIPIRNFIRSKDKKIANLQDSWFSSAFIYKGFLYLLPQFYPEFVSLNLENFQLSYYGKNELRKLSSNTIEDKYWFFRSISIDDKYAYSPLYNSNYICRYDLNMHTREYIQVPSDALISAAIKVQEGFLYSDRKEHCLKLFNQISKTENKIISIANCRISNEPCYTNIYRVGENIVYIPERSRFIYVINEQDFSNIYKLCICEGVDDNIAYAWLEDKNNIWFVCLDSQTIKHYNSNFECVKEIQIDQIEIKRKDINKHLSLINESDKFNLQDFLDVYIQI